jgi:hypothetical protein
MFSVVIARTVLILLPCICLLAQAQDFDATQNIQLGMQGLMQAGSDPALLAQLMKDMQVCFVLFHLVLLFSIIQIRSMLLSSVRILN